VGDFKLNFCSVWHSQSVIRRPSLNVETRSHWFTCGILLSHIFFLPNSWLEKIYGYFLDRFTAHSVTHCHSDKMKLEMRGRGYRIARAA